MSISIEEVNRIAKLARLNFSDAEKQKLQKELSDILNYVDQLKEIEGKSLDLEVDESSLNLMRDDVAIPVDNPDEFLSQAPAREGKFLKVKSVLE
jgi:aspartyl-tRNA(Asn)/glutamyl-tRNA(Gln) amidotransferase subunit C